MPGYGFEELVELLTVKGDLYEMDEVLYLLNPDDYARRNSVYEGADNGTYRMYHRPGVMSLWFLRKAVYRSHKAGMISIGWYEWLFAGNEDRGYARIREMKEYCGARRCRMTVVLLPAGSAYTPGGYALAPMYDALEGFLEAHEIPHLSPVEAFAADAAGYFDHTDHFHDAGNVQMAALLRDFLGQIGAWR